MFGGALLDREGSLQPTNVIARLIQSQARRG